MDGDDNIFISGGSNLIDGGGGIDYLNIVGTTTDFTIAEDDSDIFDYSLTNKNNSLENLFKNLEYINFRDNLGNTIETYSINELVSQIGYTITPVTIPGGFIGAAGAVAQIVDQYDIRDADQILSIAEYHGVDGVSEYSIQFNFSSIDGYDPSGGNHAVFALYRREYSRLLVN